MTTSRPGRARRDDRHATPRRRPARGRRGLQKHFPITPGPAAAPGRRGAGRRRARLRRCSAGETLGAGRRVRAAARRPPGRLITRLLEPTGGTIDVRGPRHHAPVAGADAPAAPRHPDDLPGPVLVAEPAAHGRHDRRRAVPAPGRRARGRRQEGGPGAAASSSASTPSTTTATRTSSPAASASASASPARSRCSPS